VIGLVALVPVKEPGDEVAVKVETAAPPVAFAVNGTDAEAGLVTRSVAVPIVGACGTVVAVIELDAAEAAPVAVELVGVTVKV
jgi:hypothetical protein